MAVGMPLAFTQDFLVTEMFYYFRLQTKGFKTYFTTLPFCSISSHPHDSITDNAIIYAYLNFISNLVLMIALNIYANIHSIHDFP